MAARGRPKGSRNLASKAASDIFKYFDFDPLSKLIKEYNDLVDDESEAGRKDRITVAKELMRYRHPALANITIGGDKDRPLTVNINKP